MRNREAGSWPEFYATQRVLPYLKLARDRQGIAEPPPPPSRTWSRRLADLAGPDEPPARLHGDLWAGNLIWGRTAGCG